MKGPEPNCFGFYAGGVVCTQCRVAKRCKAILVSDGFDVVGAMVERLVEDLPQNAVFTDTNRIDDMIRQLLHPEKKPNQDEEDLLNLLEKSELSREEAQNLGAQN